MTIGELISELKKMDQEMPVCGESETSTWDMQYDDLVPTRDVRVYGKENPYEKALILGYKHTL